MQVNSIPKCNIVTSILVSSVTAMLVMIFIPVYDKVHSDRYQSAPLAENIATYDDKITRLQSKIEMLVEKQKKLADRNDQLEQKIGLLRSGDEFPDTIANDEQLRINTMEIEQEEQEIANASENPNGEFDKLIDQLQYEKHDSEWNTEMQSSLSEIENRLNDLNFGSMKITYSQCGSQSCLVEFTHDEAVDPAFIAGLLSAKAAAEVVLKGVEENGVNKTLAIYIR